MPVIVTQDLTRRFGAITAVDRLCLELPVGGVIGLLGPNGAGKSTLIRMLLGLVRPSQGDAQVLGSSIHRPAEYAERVGALVESPAFVAGLSARANLLSLARLRGLPTSRVGEVLALVGLSGRDREPVRRFSLGMKQRLGIAAALLPLQNFWGGWPASLNAPQILMLASLGVLGAISQWCLIRAYVWSSASFIAPLLFMQLMWSTATGYLFFGQLPDSYSLIGILVILTSGAATMFFAARSEQNH